MNAVNHEETLTSAEARVLGTVMGNVREDISSMREEIKSIGETLQALARLEIEHQETRQSLLRAFTGLEKTNDRVTAMEERLRVIEIVMPGLKETRAWVIGLVIGCAALVFVALAALVLHPIAIALPDASKTIQR